MTANILGVLSWLIGGLFVAIIMLLSYALMSLSSSTRCYEDELIEFEQLNKHRHEKDTTNRNHRTTYDRMHDTKEVQPNVSDGDDHNPKG